VLHNDTDADNDPLTIATFSQPGHGNVTVNSDGSFTYTPETGFIGTDIFTYKATDGTATSGDATVTITVHGPNTAPVAANDGPFTTDEDTPLTVPLAQGVLHNDTDADDDTLTAAVGAQPQHGSVTLAGDGTFTYTPAANFHGTDTFTYKANDVLADSNVATVTITVNSLNDAPVGVADAYDASESTPLVVDAASGLIHNDTDADGTTPTIASFSQPGHGSVTVSTDGSFTYTPIGGFVGTDTFTYKATDGTVDSADTTVTITVSAQNHAPVAVDDSGFSTDEDTALTVSLAQGVLHNDTDADDDTLHAAVLAQPQNGSVTLASDGTFTYTPAANFHGTDTFTYKANDGQADSNVATVTITVNPVNDVPQGHFDSYAVAKDGTLTVSDTDGVLKNDTDADDDTLTAVKVDDVQNGTLTLNSDGSFTYTPTAGFTGTDTFTYKAKDSSNAESAVTTVTIRVDAPPVVQDDPDYTTDEDSPLVTNDTSGVLANDHDPESDPMQATVVDQPQNGSVSLGTDGSFTYTPKPDFNGTDTFTYQASDGVATSTIATVTITVNAVNDPPVATADSYTGAQDTQLVIGQNSGVLSNDSDPEGTPLSVTAFTQPANGTVTVGTDGSFTYMPTSGFSGDDTFDYTASDGDATADATVTISVQAAGGEGESPLAANDAALMSLLAPTSDPTSTDTADYQAAVDAAMSQLG
jgi:VCBS repeat-containing protein